LLPISLLCKVAWFSSENQAGDGESGDDAREGQANANGGEDRGNVVKFEILEGEEEKLV
jgi:hypothetical protein